MTDQQDLRARLPELPKPKRFFGHSTNMPMYTSEEMKDYALEAAAQLGRVGEPVAYIDPADLQKMMNVRDRSKPCKAYCDVYYDSFGTASVPLYTSPQLPAGVPDDDREVIADMLEKYMDALTTGEIDNAGHYPASAIAEQIELLATATPQPDSAAPGGGCDACGRIAPLHPREYAAAIDALANFNPGADEFTHALEALRGHAPEAVALCAPGGDVEQRAHFERWVSKRWGCSTEKWADSGEYQYHMTRDWWQCWKAALSAPKLVDQNPVGEVVVSVNGSVRSWNLLSRLPDGMHKLYTSPQAAPVHVEGEGRHNNHQGTSDHE